MRIVWNNDRFEAELTPGESWRPDKDSVQHAGFKTEGPPTWTWFTTKASVLNKLRENKPLSGLIITEVALQKYKTQNEVELKKEQLRKQWQTAKKQAQKQSKDPDISGMVDLIIPEKGYIGAEDFPPLEIKLTAFPKSDTISSDYCFICGDPVYFYEKLLPTAICIFCEKELDKN